MAAVGNTDVGHAEKTKYKIRQLSVKDSDVLWYHNENRGSVLEICKF